MPDNREKNYFDMFVTSVGFSCKIATRLKAFINSYSSIKDLEAEVWDIHNLEHEADQHFHTIYQQLNASFITPIDREDILLLSQAIDDVTDSIEDVAFSVYYLNIKELKPDVFDFVELIEKSCLDLKKAIHEFRNFKKSKELFDLIMNVNAVEEQGDHLYCKMLRGLFTGSSDALDIMKRRELYEKLECCLDSCENVADVLEGIVLKNS